MEDMLAKLQALPTEGRSASCQHLLDCLQLQHQLVSQLRQPIESVAQATDIVLAFLASYYHGISALPGIIKHDLHEAEMVKSLTLLPFVGPSTGEPEGGAIEFGIPSSEGPDVVCDTVDELSRVCGAAVISYYVYLNYAQAPGNSAFPPDDALLLYSSMAIRSCQEPEAAAAIQADLAQRGSPVGLAQLRWLMHFLRAQLTHFTAQICGLMKKEQQEREYWTAHQQDCLHLIKAVPDNCLGHLAYVRSCLRFQQHKVAHLFASRGLDVAAAGHEDVHSRGLLCARACALALGGAGAQFAAAEVAEGCAAAEAALASAKAWLPQPFHELLAPGHEEVVAQAVLKRTRDAAGEAREGKLPPLQLLYGEPPPTSLPPGAVMAQ